MRGQLCAPQQQIKTQLGPGTSPVLQQQQRQEQQQRRRQWEKKKPKQVLKWGQLLLLRKPAGALEAPPAGGLMRAAVQQWQLRTCRQGGRGARLWKGKLGLRQRLE